jgi:DNA (cytosine-5)-methyltransferase 1
VSFFSGCGGLDLGFIGGFEYLNRKFSRTNFDILAAFDSDPDAVHAYQLNLGPHISQADLASAKISEMPTAPVLIGGFPCQEFSQCGPRKGISSERGRLYLAMVEYARLHQPKIIIGENVAGLKYIDSGKALKTIEQDFLNIGYRCRTWEIKANEYGVPQARHRLILAFVRSDLNMDALTAPVAHSIPEISASGAISDLLKPINRKAPNQQQYFKAAKASRGHGQGDEKTPANGPAYTIRANSRSRVQFHYSRPRRLTVRECARLQTFPDNFIFPFKATANMKLIGNAVPPVLGYQIAACVSSFLKKAQIVSG